VTEHPHFILELTLVNTATRVKVQEPALITDELVNEAWAMVNDFIMDMIDDLGIADEITDERFRELFIELCYKLVYREMTTLIDLPSWEKHWKEALAKGKQYRGPRRVKKGDSN
jgi:hypothetical protein